MRRLLLSQGSSKPSLSVSSKAAAAHAKPRVGSFAKVSVPKGVTAINGKALPIPSQAVAVPKNFYSTAANNKQASVEQIEELCRAAAQGDLDSVKQLLGHGIPVNATVEFFGRTPLHYAVSEARLSVVKFLIEKGADVNMPDRHGVTAMQEAMKNRYKSQVYRDIIKVLEQHGGRKEADINSFRFGADFVESLRKSVPVLCDRGGWDFGEALVPYQDNQVLHPSGAVWAAGAEAERFFKLRKASEAVLKYDPEKGDFPARVARTKSTEWISDFTKLPAGFVSDDTRRLCNDAGVRSAMAVPVVHKDTLLAVLVFLSLKPRSFDKGMIEDFNSICSRLIFASMENVKQVDLVTLPANQSQLTEVQKLIGKEGVFSETLVYQELDWYYNRLGLQQSYFTHYSPQQVAKHVHAFIASKKVAQITNHIESLQFDFETPEGWFHLCPMLDSSVKEVEEKIAEHILAVQRAARKKDEEMPNNNFRRSLESLPPVPYSLTFFRSKGGIAPSGPGSSVHLGLYISEQSEFIEPYPTDAEKDVKRLCTRSFLARSNKAEHDRYQSLMERTLSTVFPVIEAMPKEADGTIPLFFSYRTQAIGNFLRVMTQLLKVNNYVAERKHVDTFSNGVVMFALYITPRQDMKAGEKQCSIESLVEQASLLYHISESALSPLMELSIETYAYSYCAANFIYYFVNTRSEEFTLLAEALKGDPVNIARLNMFQKTLRRDAVTVARINECLLNPAHREVLSDLYADFASVQRGPLSGQNKAVLQKIKKTVLTDLDEQILSSLALFNSLVVKTNFWKKDKAAISFRLKTDFIAGHYPAVPYGLFYVMGADFRGFHMRFRDIARGGIRVIASRGKQVYRRNLDTLFAENYGLASTQQAKNKDLPEGGSKGVILLDSETASATYSFNQYIDAVLDLLLPGSRVVNHYKQLNPSLKDDEILFMGPDEGTAGYMDWAAEHARSRGYRFWKAFTTGKSPRLGGIPHDTYGMTTRSIHKYVTEILKKYNLREEDITKVQIGGPDGDLGSNEILISKDRTIAVVDKSGVVYDPAGLNRDELRRLATERLPIEHFSRSKLGSMGFMVLVGEKEITLPTGDVIESGLAFRNEFHLTKFCTADLFVPCGGRPEAINVRNVKNLINADGTPRVKYVVEGANLFLTQDARLQLEKAGVILYKDASANKGGVTSSSLEVLAALSMSDQEFATHMQVRPDGTIPQFYQTYVQQVQERIEHNALLEFESIWRENERSKTPRCVLTDKLSLKINDLTDSIKAELWSSTPEPLRARVLQTAIPPALEKLLGIDTIMKRVPANYLQAIFGAHLASHYVYSNGLDANEMTFYKFMQNYLANNAKK